MNIVKWLLDKAARTNAVGGCTSFSKA